MKMRFSSLFSSLILSFSFAIFSPNSTAFPSSYTPESLPLYADEALSKPIGELEAGVPVKLVQTTQNADQLELEMWRKTKGFGRIWYNQFAKHITKISPHSGRMQKALSKLNAAFATNSAIRKCTMRMNGWRCLMAWLTLPIWINSNKNKCFVIYNYTPLMRQNRNLYVFS